LSALKVAKEKRPAARWVFPVLSAKTPCVPSGAIAEMTKRGRTNGALDAINSQRKVRAELVAQRHREAEALAGLKTEQAAALAKAHAVEVEVAPIMYVAQLLGGTTGRRFGG
jgi:hypothetical protein